jgi:hypothetical protein
MNSLELNGWNSLRHGGLLLDTPRLRDLSQHVPPPLPVFYERELRRFAGTILDDSADTSEFVFFVLQKVCGFGLDTGTWQRGPQVGAEWNRRAITGEAVKPRQIWRGQKGGLLPVFIDTEKRLGIGRGRRATSQVLQWLRGGAERLSLLTNGRQWRLIFAGLDFDAWCEWDVELWFEEGALSPQLFALRTLICPTLWTPPDKEAPPPLLQAILDSRKGQAELSAVLGERVREAVEVLVQAHGEVLKERCAEVSPAAIYRAAVRMVMRMVVVLFAESRDLLPRENAVYHGVYGLTGLLEELEKVAARGGNRLVRSWSAWPRVLALFRLVYQGSHHAALPVPAYGGELFATGNSVNGDALEKVLSVFETACFERELMSDKDVLRVLERITRTRMKLRQGRASTWVPAPVDFSDLSSEYIGILYEGLLDFELKTAPSGDPVVFLSVGNQPALPLSRLEAMDDKAIENLLEKMKDTSRGEDTEREGEAEEAVEEEAAASEGAESGDAEGAEEEIEPEMAEEDSGEASDERHTTRTRAETWARRAVVVGKLVRKPRGTMTPEKRLVYEETISRKSRQLVTRVILPGEWYLVRWGGTRKGAGTFYTRPGLAVPTVHRTLRPLAYDPPKRADGEPDLDASPSVWTPKTPETILALKVCDPACGSGTFAVAALRFLTDALFASLHHHDRIVQDGERAVVRLLSGVSRPQHGIEERLGEELLPCRPEDPLFEQRLKAVLRRHLVERCIYGVDLDPLAVELCRLALWIETMDRDLPFSFLDHKIKCGNSLVGAWFDQFQHYPVMAWKNREGGDKSHSNGVHFKQEERSKAIKGFVKDTLTPDLRNFLKGKTLFQEDLQEKASKAHDDALATLSRLHDLPVHDSAERARIYREELLGSTTYQSLKNAMDLWCACWFWPTDALEHASLPSTLADPSTETLTITKGVAERLRFFHWELEFPDVFCKTGSGFDAMLGNPPWDIAKPSSMEFFSNFDPLYRSYGKQEALRYQSDYFADQKVEHEWLDYSADFRAQSNFMAYAASPFGDPVENEKSTDRFSIERGKKNDALHARWREARVKSHGFADPAHPFRHQGSADINLYKLSLEQVHALLRQGGRMGFIAPSGIYSDHGTGSLRHLFLDRCRWEWLFGFENRDGIFEIHRSYKFNPIIIEKGNRTGSIRTVFMRRKLEDWERAESLATLYTRAQVERFSPRSKAVLEIQSQRDLEILEKIYANSVLLGDDGPEGWGIKYAREFDMTNDSKLFPPRPKWEAEGYRPDEYSRWLKGDWRPIAQLWTELGVDPSDVMPIDPSCKADLDATDVHRTNWRLRCAQPPYDTLPIPRANIPAGIILSRDGRAWLQDVEDPILPVYSAKTFDLLDFAAKGWVRGKGRGAVWEPIGFPKNLAPEYLMSLSVFAQNIAGSYPWHGRLLFKDIATAVHQRTMLCAITPPFPAVNASPSLETVFRPDILFLACQLGSLVLDFVARLRIGYLHLNYFVIEELPLLARQRTYSADVKIAKMGVSLSTTHEVYSPLWLATNRDSAKTPWRGLWAATQNERVRLKCSIDALIASLFDLGRENLRAILSDCDRSVDSLREGRGLAPKGFWRVDKDKDPELRHTVLTLVAFHDLEQKIRDYGGDRERGIEAFLNQNNGEGWMLPETLRLADYGLGHDDRATEHQPVASRLGPRFYDWQLAQTPEESWRECHLHARNMLGEVSYLDLLGEVLRDTAEGGWAEALTLAYELSKKENLLHVFEVALGSLPPASWRARLDEAKGIMSERGFILDHDDLIQIIIGALRRVPEDKRSEGLNICRGLLVDDGPRRVTKGLLAFEFYNPNGPWHVLARKQLGQGEYRTLIAELEAQGHSEVAEPAVSYDVSKGKMSQRRLF